MNRIALVHDSLCGTGGAEKVFKAIAELFPTAEIYTLAYNPAAVDNYFETRVIRTAFPGKILRSMEIVRWLYPINAYLMEAIDFEEYDLIISSSTTIGKHVNSKKALHICYCYYPPRAIWESKQYFQRSSLKSALLRIFLDYLRRRDRAAADKIDYIITQSPPAQKKIREIYSRSAPIIPGPITDPNVTTQQLNQVRSHFLIVSRLEEWKSLDHAIEAFNILSLPLKVVGSGTQLEYLKRINTSDKTEFLGFQDEESLKCLYLSARALVFTPDLEYGITPIEALSFGCPVIAYDSPGVRFTLSPYISTASENELDKVYTSVHYTKQTAEALVSAVDTFCSLTFNSLSLHTYSNKFSKKSFQDQISHHISSLLKQ